MATKKLFLRTAKEADRMLWISLAIGLACMAFTVYMTNSWLIAAAVGAVPCYSLLRRVFLGAPLGAPILELAGDMLVFRNPLFVPPKVERQPVAKLYSIAFTGEEGRRYFQCLDTDGETRNIGPFERLPDARVIALWFHDALPEVPLAIHESAIAGTQIERGIL